MTTIRRRSDFEGKPSGTPITRLDIAVIADVQPRTVQAWAQKAADFPEKIQQGRQALALHRLGDVVEWLCRTGRLECGIADKYLTMDQIAELLGVKVVTVKVWRRRGIFPLPEIRIGRVPLWSAETVKGWEGRPQRGGNRRTPASTGVPRCGPLPEVRAELGL